MVKPELLRRTVLPAAECLYKMAGIRKACLLRNPREAVRGEEQHILRLRHTHQFNVLLARAAVEVVETLRKEAVAHAALVSQVFNTDVLAGVLVDVRSD